MRSAGIYVRISQDRGGEGLGVQRQEQDCRKLCERNGWEVTNVYVDNDVSAYSGKARPEWKRLLHDIEIGVVNAIAVWDVDRLTRTPMELEGVITLADVHHIELATVTGHIDLSTPNGRMVARMLGAAARMEVEHKSERQRRQRQQSAERGEPNFGGTRPFGYEDDRVTIRPDEAEIIRECAKRVLANESTASICRDLKDRGVLTAAGKTFVPSKLRQMLCSARISGRREHEAARKGHRRALTAEIVGQAQWPAIISAEDSDRLRKIFTDPARRKYSPGTGRKYLLTGILKCGLCGHNLNGRPKGDTPRYVCPNTPGALSCGRLATVSGPTDELIRDMVLVALASPALTERLRQRKELDPELPKAVEKDEDALTDLAEVYADGGITRAEWMIARDKISVRLERNRKLLAEATATAPLLDLVGDYDDLLERWEALNVGQRQAIVTSVLERVDVMPADPKKKWDPDRFKPVWRF